MDIIVFTPDSPFGLDPELLSGVIEGLPRGIAPGPSGWRYEHVQVLCAQGSGTAQSMYRLFNTAAQGAMKNDVASDFWGMASLAALKKGESLSGVRPVAMSQAFRNVLARTMLRQIMVEIREAVGKHQYGVSVHCGLEAVVCGARIMVVGNKENVVLKIDVKNAHNTFVGYGASRGTPT